MEKLDADILEEIRGEGEPIIFSPEEYTECRKRCIEFSQKESNGEIIVRRERVRAAARPPVIITF